MKTRNCAGCRKTSCDGCRIHPGRTLNSNKNKWIDFPENFVTEEKSGYGIVFDVGTTTVAAMLWDLKKAEMLAAETEENPQAIVGIDVASRIAYCMEADGKEGYLKQLIVEAMDDMAQRLWKSIEPDGQIKEAVVVGNTAMCEILLGLSVEGLARAPFQKGYQGCVCKAGAELGFQFLSKAQITVLPAIDGYVGADALAVYTYIKAIDERKNILAVDIGTNGEILLFGEDQVFACSAPAGPALEGAAVVQGMRAVPEAIETVQIYGSFPREDIACKVIGDTEPKGICGSGLVDALALLTRLQVIDKDGYLRSSQEARKAGVKERFCQRIQEADGERRFLLTQEPHPVYLTAGDIRQLQLAKGAIRGAIEVLLHKAGIQVEDICHLYLAGAFGSYIKIESALAIGLLPGLPMQHITHTGNCAATGGAMALLSDGVRKEMEKSAYDVRHVELALEKDFQESFIKFMDMP